MSKKSKWLRGNEMTKSFPRKYREGKESNRIHDLTLSIGMLQVIDVTSKSAANMELEEEGNWRFHLAGSLSATHLRLA